MFDFPLKLLPLAPFANVQAAKRELERQRQLEWERQRRQELLTQRNREQESIVVLKARKKTLEFELEVLVMKHERTQSHVLTTWCLSLLFMFPNATPSSAER